MPFFAAETRLVFIVVFGLVSILSMGANLYLLKLPSIQGNQISALVGFNLLLVVTIILALIELYGRTFTFIQPEALKALILKNTRKAVIESVDNEIRYRLAYQIIEEQCREIGIHTEIFRPELRMGFASVKAIQVTNEGKEVSDVNIQLLALARKRMSLIMGDQQIDSKGLIYWGFPRLCRVNIDKPEFALIPNVVNRPSVVNLLRNGVRWIPFVERSRTAHDENLRLSRDLLVDAIEGTKAEVVAELLDQYTDTIKTFLEALKQYGLTHTEEASRREDGFFPDWPVITILQRQFVSLLELALSSKDREIVNDFVGFPFLIMSLALSYGDHLVFTRFSSIYPHIYSIAKRQMSEELQDVVVTRRVLKLLSDYYRFLIIPRVTEEIVTEADLETFGEFGRSLGLTFNNLLKEIFDSQDLSSFQMCVETMDSLANLGTEFKRDLKTLKIQVELARDQEFGELTELEAEYERKRRIASELENLRHVFRVSLFGMGGWIIDLFDRGSISADQFKGYIGRISLIFGNLSEFYQLYSGIFPGSDRDSQFNWSSWESKEFAEDIAGPKFRRVSYPDWLGKFYAFRTIQLVPGQKEGAPDLSPINASKGVLDVLKKNIHDFSSSDKWSELLGDFSGRAEVLIAIHQDAIEQRLAYEQNEIIHAGLDERLVGEFSEEVLDEWESSAVLRKLIKRAGKYEEELDESPPTDLEAFGFFNRLHPKEDFVELNEFFSPSDLITDIGVLLGRQLARFEDKQIAAKFRNLNSISCPTRLLP